MAYLVNDTRPLYVDDIDKFKEYGAENFESDEGGMNETIVENLDSLVDAVKHVKKKPIIDWDTKNRSFLILFQDLVKLGVKNNKFFLRLYDKDLKGIDPYNKLLPPEFQLKIFLECVINPWYYLREICRIPEDGKPIEVGGGTQYQIDRNSVASWYLFLNGIDHYVSKPRQTGKTQNSLAIVNYCMHFGTMSSTITFGNKDADNNRQNLYRLKCQRDMMPAYLQMKIAISDGKIEKEIDNVTSMRNPVTKNHIKLLSRATSADAANSIGRGFTSAIQYWDEIDFMPYNMVVLGSSVFAYAKASENARRNGSVTARVFSSTPGDLDTRDGEAAALWVEKMFVWKDIYFNEPIEKLIKSVKAKGKNGIVFVEHTWQQLRKSNEWYEYQCQLVDYDQTRIMREIDLKRIHGSNRSPFRREDIFYITTHQKSPISTVDYSDNLSSIDLYEVFDKRYPYLLVVDPSEGLGMDNNAMTVINPYTLKPAAEFKSPFISPSNMCKMIVKFMDEYCPRALIIIESNRGRELINRLLETKYRYRLYVDADKLGDPVKDSHDDYGAKKEARIRRAYGFDTNRQTRNMLFTILENLMTEEKEKLISKNLVEDICALERKTSGKIEASAGRHDDCVMSYLIGLCVYYHATNLEEYGIVRGSKEPMTNVDLNSPEAIKAKIDELVSYLPEEAKQVFTSVEEKDPTKEAFNYYSQIQNILNATPSLGNTQKAETLIDPLAQFDPNESDAASAAMDKFIWDMSEKEDQYGEYNLDDFL